MPDDTRELNAASARVQRGQPKRNGSKSRPPSTAHSRTGPRGWWWSGHALVERRGQGEEAEEEEAHHLRNLMPSIKLLYNTLMITSKDRIFIMVFSIDSFD